jgi:malate dehydrogenase (oxaloacetate-decarboxylating)
MTKKKQPAAKKKPVRKASRPVRRSAGNVSQEALLIHKKLRGKISIMPKARVANKKDLGLFYTPGVGAVSIYLAEHPEKCPEYTLKGNSIAIVSDGSAVLGLGNIGPAGAYPVMEGKAMLFKTLSGIDGIPILLSTQNPDEIVAAVKAIAPTFGGINLEDIAAPKCFAIEARLRAELDIPVLHDDQHGTALVALAGLINALKVVRKDASAVRVIIAGAGAAGQAIAGLLSLYGVGDILMVDSRGILSPERTDLDMYKMEMVKMTNRENRIGTLADAFVASDVFIGVSKGGTVGSDDIERMNADPIVFALANPVPEIMPEEAKKGGAAVVATGRSDFPNQINNALGFPGIFRGALDHKVRVITDQMLITAAKRLAAIVTKPTAEMIIPGVFDKRVVLAVAEAIRRS